MAFYDFASLSPNDFELLIADLLNAEYGWELESFASGPDGGVDLRGRLPYGELVVQCKHYDRSSMGDLIRAARDEKAKMDRHRPARYLFATSQVLTLTQKDRVSVELRPWLGSTADLLTRSDLNRMLARHPQIERLHFKLWLASAEVLARIAQSATWARSAALIEELPQRVQLYVSTPAYQRAVDTLNQSNMVVITGAPGVGKSMLADMLTVNLWKAGWQVVSVSSDIDQAWEAHQPEKRQVFLYDDFLGETDLSEALPKNEAARLAELIRHVRRNDTKRLIMTTRRHQLRQMQTRSEILTRADLPLVEVVVEIDDYGLLDRARILYNHLYYSDIPREQIDGFVRSGTYRQVIDHPNFAPRLVADALRWQHTSAEALGQRFQQAMDQPHGLWASDFARQPVLAQNILLAMVSYPGEAPEKELRRFNLGDHTPLQYRQTLKALEEVWISINQPMSREPGGGMAVRYANPSCRDFVLSLINEIPDYALAVAAGACNSGSVFTLLGYATSTTDGVATFPGLATLADDRSLHARWFTLLVHQQSGVESPADADAFYRNLRHTTGWDKYLAVDARAWLDRQWEEFAHYVPLDASEFRAESAALFLLQDVRSGRVADGSLAMASIVERWAVALEEDDQVAALHDFCTQHASLVGNPAGMFDALRRGLSRRVSRQASQVIEGSEDMELAQEWLDDLEQFVKTYDLDSALLVRIDEVRAEARSIAEDPEQILLDQAIEAWCAAGCPELPGAEPREPMPAEVNQQIDTLFLQLTRRELRRSDDMSGPRPSV